MEWESLPLRNIKKSALFLGSIGLTFFLFTYAFGLYWGVLSIIVLLGANFSFFTTTRYRINREGVFVHKPFYTVHRSFNWIKRIERDKNGVFLSPFEKRSFLDPFRGVFLISSEPEKVEKFIHRLKNGSSN